MRTKCNSIQRLLSDYIDGILPDKQIEKVDQHLMSCPKCRAVLSSLEKTNRILDLYIEKEPPAGYFDNVWTQIEHKITEKSRVNYWLPLRNKLYFKLRILRNKLYDEFVWWANQVSWAKLLWKSVIVILLISSAVVIDRTYFRPSVDKTFIQNITQSLSKDGLYLIKYTPRPNRKSTISREPRGVYKAHLTKNILLNTQKTPDFISRPSGYFPHSSSSSVIKFGNGFLTIRNVEILDSDTAEEQSNFVNLYDPKNITQVKINHINNFRAQINSVNIQDIQQSFRRKDDTKSPFRVFLADFKTSDLRLLASSLPH